MRMGHAVEQVWQFLLMCFMAPGGFSNGKPASDNNREQSWAIAVLRSLGSKSTF